MKKTKREAPLLCAWCRKPAKVFVARLPHCGGSHVTLHHKEKP